MLLMSPETMNAIAQKAEAELPPGKKIAIIAGVDIHGVDVEVVARVVGQKEDGSGPIVKFVTAYHHAFDGDPSERDSFGVKFVAAG